jgi:hypothetical protein
MLCDNLVQSSSDKPSFSMRERAYTSIYTRGLAFLVYGLQEHAVGWGVSIAQVLIIEVVAKLNVWNRETN